MSTVVEQGTNMLLIISISIYLQNLAIFLFYLYHFSKLLSGKCVMSRMSIRGGRIVFIKGNEADSQVIDGQQGTPDTSAPTALR